MIQPANETYRQLLADLHNANIRYALLRDDLHAGQPIKDLDILVSKNELSAFDRIAGERGFYLIKDGFLNPGKRVYLKIENGRPHILDVHTEVIFRGLVFLDGNKALADRQQANGFYRLSNEDILISLLFHNLLAKERVQEKHQPLLHDLLAQARDRDALQTRLDAFGMQKIFEQLTRDFVHTCDHPELVKKLAARARRKLLWRKPANLLRVWQMWRREKSVKFFGKKRGLVIAFLGPDGAGKSTTIEAIKAHLKALGIGTKVAYLGPWGGSVLNLRSIFSRLHLTPYRDDYKAYDKGRLVTKPGPLKGMKNLRFQMRSGLYYALLLFEMAVRWLVRVAPLLRQGRVVLSDRYLYDILTGYKNKPIDYHHNLRRWLCKLYPKPDLGIVLDAMPEVIHARKPQLTETQLQQSRNVYREIARQHDFFVLDTSSSVEATLRDFEARILPVLLARLDGRKISKLSNHLYKAKQELAPADFL